MKLTTSDDTIRNDHVKSQLLLKSLIRIKNWIKTCKYVTNRSGYATKTILAVSILSILFLFTGCGNPSPLILGGTVEAESIDVVTEVGGRIEKLLVEEGQVIDKGTIVAEIDDSIQEQTVKQLEQAVIAKEAKYNEVEIGNRAEQIDQAQFAYDAATAQYKEMLDGPSAEQLKSSEAQVTVSLSAVNSARILADYTEQTRKDSEALYKSGDLSESTYKDVVYKRDAAQSGLKTAQRQLESAQAQYNQIKKGSAAEAITAAKARADQSKAQLELVQNGATDNTVQMAKADVDQSKAALEQAKLVQEKYRIAAPCSGVVTLLSFNEGEVVNGGAALGTVSDLKDLSVRLYIPQKNLSSIELGKELMLTVTSLPGKKIPAQITWISDVAEFTPRNTETTASKETTVFRFKLTVSEENSGLKPGMSLEAEIPGAVSGD